MDMCGHSEIAWKDREDYHRVMERKSMEYDSLNGVT